MILNSKVWQWAVLIYCRYLGNDWKLSCKGFTSHPLPPEALCGQMIGFTVATGTEVVLVPKAVGTARLEVEVWVECGMQLFFSYCLLVCEAI